MRALLTVLFFFSSTAYAVWPTDFRVAMQELAAAGSESELSRGGSKPLAPAVLSMYHQRAYMPLWVGESGLSSRGYEALSVLQQAERWGLLRNYDVRRSSARERGGASVLAATDYGITAALTELALDLAHGHVNPKTSGMRWHIFVAQRDPAAMLNKLIEAPSVSKFIDALAPNLPGYAGLLGALEDYEILVAEGGWPRVRLNQKVELGDRHPALVTLRTRLQIQGYNVPPTDDPKLFDLGLEDALKAFQTQHGLNADGVMGRRTREAINVTAIKRRDQIIASLERYRWLPHELTDRYGWVNIPAYNFSLIVDGKERFEMRAVVGKKKRPTPIFNGEISYLEMNPRWNIPKTIAAEDIVPAMRRDPNYLARKKIRVYEGWARNSPEIDPATINWDELKPGKNKRLPFRMSQDPGRRNSLGRVKFMFPNKFDVYLHDTPSRGLFNRDYRAHSSGCVRVQRPKDFAEFLLSEHKDKKINYDAVLKRGKTKKIYLDRNLPVYLVYFTAWVDNEGKLQFREDIYDHDRTLTVVLNKVADSHVVERIAALRLPKTRS